MSYFIPTQKNQSNHFLENIEDFYKNQPMEAISLPYIEFDTGNQFLNNHKI